MDLSACGVIPFLWCIRVRRRDNDDAIQIDSDLITVKYWDH
jgi:hypothetical protein